MGAFDHQGALLTRSSLLGEFRPHSAPLWKSTRSNCSKSWRRWQPSPTLRLRPETINAAARAQSSVAIVDVLVHACKEVGSRYLRMVSRAHHDTILMSRVARVGMLFKPCRGGVSHRSDEYASPDDIARGVRVPAGAFGKLAA